MSVLLVTTIAQKTVEFVKTCLMDILAVVPCPIWMYRLIEMQDLAESARNLWTSAQPVKTIAHVKPFAQTLR